MDAALASVEASSASSPAPETTSDPAAATATTSPETPDPTQVPGTETETPKGEPPKWRWQDILSNARESAAKETEARVRQEVETQYAGVKDFATLDANERAGLLVLHRAMAGDVQSREMVAQAQPQLAQSLGWVNAPPSPADDPMPEADLQAQDGTLVYSAAQQAKKDDWLVRKLTTQITGDLRKEFDSRFKPVNDVLTAHENAKAHHTVSSALTKFRADADFTTHEKDVLETLKKDAWLWDLADTDPERALDIAYSRVYRSVIVPAREQSLKATSEASVLTNLQSRAVSGTTNPATTATSTPRKPRSMAEAFEQVGA